MHPRRIVQGFFAFIYLTLIILTIPLAFDVGGEDCGIAFTFTLSMFYLVMSTVRILSRNTKFSIFGSLLYYLQHIIIPSLLILHLSLFSKHPSSTWLWALGPWRFFVKHATPLFTTLEGFCTLLVIQATGQITRWLIRKSDTWMFVQIVAAGLSLTSSLYFLYRIYTFPVEIELSSATLIGAALTMATILGGYGIVSGKGTAIESSALFSYVVYCLYVTFTDFQSSITPSLLFPFLAPPPQTPVETGFLSSLFRLGSSSPPPTHTVSLPPIIVTGYTNMMATIAELIPQGFVTVFEFFIGAMSTITPSVAVSLAYRMVVFYAATRIIPALNSRPPPGLKRRSKSQPVLFVIYSYAPCIIIAVYTHLLIQHSALHNDQGTYLDILWGNSKTTWIFWGWINVFLTLTLYGLELVYGSESQVLIDNHFDNHYKID
jgi:hypothetical protein